MGLYVSNGDGVDPCPRRPRRVADCLDCPLPVCVLEQGEKMEALNRQRSARYAKARQAIAEGGIHGAEAETGLSERHLYRIRRGETR